MRPVPGRCPICMPCIPYPPSLPPPPNPPRKDASSALPWCLHAGECGKEAAIEVCVDVLFPCVVLCPVCVVLCSSCGSAMLPLECVLAGALQCLRAGWEKHAVEQRCGALDVPRIGVVCLRDLRLTSGESRVAPRYPEVHRGGKWVRRQPKTCLGRLPMPACTPESLGHWLKLRVCAACRRKRWQGVRAIVKDGLPRCMS